MKFSNENTLFQTNTTEITYNTYYRISETSQHDLELLTQINNYITDLRVSDSAATYDKLTSIYHYSIPTTRLMYPEPFLASPSFMHYDLWFMHILIYQYWLWFVFIFIIVFFFLTFLSVVRWCNLRTRPRRETRGVSRSKCGDLITACVPVSWAISIIVNESTDAMDFYDGFGTTELVVGIRAYQWGWEYYYPQGLDLNYNINKNYSQFIGNSVKYNPSFAKHRASNNFYKFYQNKTYDFSVTPAHLLFLSSDKQKILNFFSAKNIGKNISINYNVFRKTTQYFKLNTSRLFTTNSTYNQYYKFFSKTYNTDKCANINTISRKSSDFIWWTPNT